MKTIDLALLSNNIDLLSKTIDLPSKTIDLPSETIDVPSKSNDLPTIPWISTYPPTHHFTHLDFHLASPSHLHEGTLKELGLILRI